MFRHKNETALGLPYADLASWRVCASTYGWPNSSLDQFPLLIDGDEVVSRWVHPSGTGSAGCLSFRCQRCLVSCQSASKRIFAVYSPIDIEVFYERNC